MLPSKVREHVLHDHEVLRRRLGEIQRLARDVVANERQHVAGLRARAQELLDTLAEHMRWEDRYLSPALEDSDAWGPERADLLAEDHREQRAFLSELVAKLNDATQPPTELAEALLDLVDRLYRDMDEEESFFLDPNVLRDDVVAIDVEAG